LKEFFPHDVQREKLSAEIKNLDTFENLRNDWTYFKGILIGVAYPLIAWVSFLINPIVGVVSLIIAVWCFYEALKFYKERKRRYNAENYRFYLCVIIDKRIDTWYNSKRNRVDILSHQIKIINNDYERKLTVSELLYNTLSIGEEIIVAIYKYNSTEYVLKKPFV
jgi:hypothetical protein